MSINLKKLLNPLACFVIGVFNFILMCFNYAVAYASYGSEKMSEGVNGYKFMTAASDLSDSSSFTLAFTSVLVIILLVLSILMILFGLFGAFKATSAGTNVLPALNTKLINKISTIAILSYIGINVLAAIFSFITLIVVREKMWGVTIGVRPGFGMYIMLLFPIIVFVALKLFGPMVKNQPAVQPNNGYAVDNNMGAYSNDDANNAAFYAGAAATATAATAATVAAAANNDDEDGAATNIDFTKAKDFFSNTANKASSFVKENPALIKRIGIIAGAALLLLVLIIIVIAAWPKATKYVIPEKSILLSYDPDKEETLIIVDGKVVESTVEGDASVERTSINGKTKAFVVDGEEEDVLYVYTGKKLLTVAEEENIEDVYLASEGTALVYVVTDKAGGEQELFHYVIKDEKAESITDEKVESICVSPDGKTVAYAECEIKDGEDEYTMFTYSGGKAEEYEDGDGLIPLAISNKAKLAYYFNVEKKAVYVQKDGKESVKILNDVNDLPTMYLNTDHTQAIFGEGNDVYFSENGGEKVKITSDGIRINKMGYNKYNSEVSSGANCSTLPMESLLEQYFIADEDRTLYYLDGKCETHKIEDYVYSFETTPTAEVVYFLQVYSLSDSGDLYRGNGYSEEGYVEIASDVTSFEITSDGEKCYFIDEDETLRYVKKTGEPKKIADDAEKMTMTHDDYLLFIADVADDETGTLYSSRNGKEKQKVADDVGIASAFVNNTIYIQKVSDDEVAIYSAKKKTKFELILEYEMPSSK